MTVRSDRQAPLAVAFGRGRTLFVDRYSGAVLGEGATGVRGFFKVNEDLHRWLAMSDDGRAQGKAITGAANLAFLFIVLSGLVLWFPRRLNSRTLRNAALFRKGSRGRARDFNWHHVFGIWAFLPLVLIVASATVISYPWATQLVYQVFGSTPPERQQSRGEREAVATDPAALDRLWSVAAAETNRVAPSWQSIGVRLPLPQDGEISVAVDEGTGARPDKRSQLMLDAASLRVIEHKTYVQQSAGQQARSWLRWIHTGEAGGLFGQLVAMLASAAAVMLVVAAGGGTSSS